ncbi:MAG: PH domain-containing protein [Arachnia sp.]
MGLPREHLGAGEEVVLHLRTHWKALWWPVLGLFSLTAVLGIGLAAAPTGWQPWGSWGIVAVYLILLCWLVIGPLLKWASTTYTVTDRRIVTRRGILNRTGHDLPLRRINNVNYERSLSDRILGCGTLILETAAGQPQVLHDVPQVERVHVAINDLLFDELEDQAVRDD